MPNSHDSPSTDATLMALLANPQVANSVWRTFLQRYRPRMLAWCAEQGEQEADAEDICSRVIQKLLVEFQTFQYDPGRSFRGFLKTVVSRVLIDEFRERVRKPGNRARGGDSRLDPVDDVDRFADELDQNALRLLQIANQAIEQVRRRTQDNTWLCFWNLVVEGQTGEQTAEQLGIPVAHVYVHKQRVIDRLRKAVDQISKSSAGSPEIPDPPPSE